MKRPSMVVELGLGVPVIIISFNWLLIFLGSNFHIDFIGHSYPQKVLNFIYIMLPCHENYWYVCMIAQLFLW